MKFKLTGLIAAPFAPLGPDGKVNLAIIPALAASLQKNGVKGAFINGTTGESMSLTVAERMQIAEGWRKASPADLALVVHVGHLALEDAKTMAAHAQSLGATATAAMAPCFFQPPTVGELVAFLGEIAAAAPNLPFYYYHIPSMTNVKFTGLAFLKAASGKIPNLAGIKFTHEDLMDFAECQAFQEGRYDILFGRDEVFLSGMATGAEGAVGSNYNFAGPIFNKVITAFNAGDIETARRYQQQARQIVIAGLNYGGQPAFKSIMKMIGLDCGPVRLPLRNLTAEQYAALREELEKLGLFAALQETAGTN
jgi:N-acetylneuraminate lyase